MKQPIQLTFKSEQTPREVYSLFINDLKAAIALNANDADKLEEIRHELMENLAFLERLQFKGGRS